MNTLTTGEKADGVEHFSTRAEGMKNILVWIDGERVRAADVRRAYQKVNPHGMVEMRLETSASGRRWVAFRTLSWNVNHDVADGVEAQ